MVWSSSSNRYVEQDDEYPPPVYFRVARHPWTCRACRQRIEQGETYDQAQGYGVSGRFHGKCYAPWWYETQTRAPHPGGGGET